MAKNKIIVLKNAREVFPNKYTICRAHDIICLSTDSENLTEKEQEKLQNVAQEIRDGGLFGENCDVIVTRNGRKLKIEKF